jgi:hypothetical protein
MKSVSLCGLALALGVMAAPAAWAQNLLPLPEVESSYASPYAADTQARTAALPGSNLVRRGYTFANTPGMEPASPSDAPGIRAGAELNAAPPAGESIAPGYSDGKMAPYQTGDYWGGGDCTGGMCGCGCCGPTWQFYAGALVMTRTQPKNIWLAYNDAEPWGGVLSTDDCGDQWAGGFEIGASRMLGCNHRLEVLYWGIFPGYQSAEVVGADMNPAGNLNSTIDFGPLTFYDGVTETAVNDWFNNSEWQRIERYYEVHNVEINLWSWCCGGNPFGCTPTCGHRGHHGCGGCDSCCCGPTWNAQWFGGLRYFQFDDWWKYSAQLGEDPWYEIETENYMVGLQMGSRVDYCHGRWGLFAMPKFGVFNNHVQHTQFFHNPNAIYGGNGGNAQVGSANPINPGDVYYINETDDVVSFLGSIDVGLDYYITSNWKATIGYRALAATNVALTTAQIPTNFGDIMGARDTDTNSSVILHGAFFQVGYTW